MCQEPLPKLRIRPLRRADREAVRRICIATAWMGGRPPGQIPDGWLWAEYWTRYFTDRERGGSWVVEQTPAGRVVGYLTGTSNAARFGRYLPRILPGLVVRVVRARLLRRPGPRTALRNLLRSLAGGELRLPPGLAERCPATFHVNLLPNARRRGLGSKLLGCFCERMRSRGIPGVHAQPLSTNEPMRRLLAKAGFHLAGSRPCSAFAHACGRTLRIETWTLDLR